MQRCLDDVLDDGRFLDIIRERLSEWDGDVDDDQFVAVWSAADYRLKFYNSLSNGNMKIENLMKAFAEVGFIPQFDVCGPPTIDLENIDVSPKGDLVSVSNLSSDYYGYDKRYITLILAGTMLPLTMIPLGTGYRQVHAFSNDSRYLATVCDDRISIWDIFNLRRIATGMIERLDDHPLITWSEDSSHVCVRSNGHIYSMSVEGGEIRELLSLGGKMTNLVLDRNGSVIMALYLQEVRFVDTLTDTVLSSYPLPVTFSGVALAYHLNGLFRIVAGGYVMLTAHDRAPEIIMDHRQDLELLMDSVDNAERYWCRNAETLWWGYSDLRHNRVSFECAEYIHSKTIRCDIDTADLSYNISAEPNNPLMEKPPAPKR